jgi:hypothetical protein
MPTITLSDEMITLLWSAVMYRMSLLHKQRDRALVNSNKPFVTSAVAHRRANAVLQAREAIVHHQEALDMLAELREIK